MIPAEDAMPQPAPRSGGDAVSREIEVMRPVLLSYAHALLPGQHHLVEDIVQETCLLLWERRGYFQEGSNFKAWAFRTAWFKVLACRRDLQRDKIVTFSEDMLQQLAGAAEDTLADSTEHRMHALRECLSSLPAEDLALLRLKYVEGRCLSDHARERHLRPNRVQKALSRLRVVLRHCIEKRLRKRL